MCCWMMLKMANFLRDSSRFLDRLYGKQLPQFTTRALVFTQWGHDGEMHT